MGRKSLFAIGLESIRSIISVFLIKTFGHFSLFKTKRYYFRHIEHIPRVYTKKYTLNGLIKSNNPKTIIENKITVYDGSIFKGKDVLPNKDNSGELENAIWLTKTFHIDVKIMPEVRQTKTLKNIKSYDYLLDDSNEHWDCKAQVSSVAKDLFRNNISQKQATSYLFDIKNCLDDCGKQISTKRIEEYINYTFLNDKYIKCIIIKNANELVGVYYNKLNK